METRWASASHKQESTNLLHNSFRQRPSCRSTLADQFRPSKQDSGFDIGLEMREGYLSPDWSISASNDGLDSSTSPES